MGHMVNILFWCWKCPHASWYPLTITCLSHTFLKSTIKYLAYKQSMLFTSSVPEDLLEMARASISTNIHKSVGWANFPHAWRATACVPFFILYKGKCCLDNSSTLVTVRERFWVRKNGDEVNILCQASSHCRVFQYINQMIPSPKQ